MINIFNNIYSCAYYPMINTVMGALTILGIFMALKLVYLKSLLITGFGLVAIICCGVSLVVITTFTATVNEGSVRFQQYLRKQVMFKREKVEQRLLRAYKVESIKCGDYYSIRKITSLALLGMILNVSGSLLISIKV